MVAVLFVEFWIHLEVVVTTGIVELAKAEYLVLFRWDKTHLDEAIPYLATEVIVDMFPQFVEGARSVWEQF